MSHTATSSTSGADRGGPARLLALATSGAWCSVALLHEQGGAIDTDCVAERFGNEQSQHILGMVRQLLRDAGWRLSDLDAIAFDAGPGAFTGLRIGCAVAQGLGFALGCPLLPIGTLEALAWQCTRGMAEPALVLVANDARMGELYAGVYRTQPSGAGALPQIMALVDPQLVTRATATAELQAMLQTARLVAGNDVDASAGASADAAATSAAAALPLLLAGDAWQQTALWPDWQHAAAPGILAQADASDTESPGLRADAIVELAHARWRSGAGIDADQAAPFYVRDKVALDVGEQQALRAARPVGDAR
ncbi:MAG: tRNA (adenosine(37)-N6)-threonylcarbamoyltransferase complex dimerization subunit type 1 TsaB [Burkholderiales bacterium]|nr:tRNA (adenosine(37)-N6)-threonylcarbamoyltransferase complex dimerization subunit type 1 TsaB [Burkholderiales bacterium]